MEKYDKSSDISYTIGTTLTFELLLRKPTLASRLYISPLQKRDETYGRLMELAKKNNLPYDLEETKQHILDFYEKEVTVGDPTSEDTKVGPLVSADQRDTVLEYIEA